MHWALLTMVLVASGVTAMLATIRAIGHTRDDLAHYRLSIRFWTLLAGLGLLLTAAFSYPIYLIVEVATGAGLLTAALTSIMPSIVVFAGLHNALVLSLAHRRRRKALASGATVDAVVVARHRRAFAYDLMTIVVEAEIPESDPGLGVNYRDEAAPVCRRQRFVETCSAEHWQQFEPGSPVRLRYEPDDLGSFALVLFAGG